MADEFTELPTQIAALAAVLGATLGALARKQVLYRWEIDDVLAAGRSLLPADFDAAVAARTVESIAATAVAIAGAPKPGDDPA